ncbi:MAG: hypothetical protein C0594_01185 [Marinilabiliales bacterium]|nr:MAG: hypothetical protein C0594_01185 [Marinilabiliales bacterium]
MGIINLLFFISVFTLSSHPEKTEADFLYLNSEQLSSLGLNLTKKGLFYKNLNPNRTESEGRNPGLMFYCTKDNYLTTTIFDESESKDLPYKMGSLKKMKMTNNDFYPVLIGDTNGNMSLENRNIYSDQKLLPVAINLNGTIKNRKDVIIVWFKPTESIKQALPENIEIERYLQERNN